MTFIEFDNKISKLMNELESKALKQALRVSLNKANAAAFKEAKKEIRERYNLPVKGKTEDRRSRPPIPTKLKKENIRGVGGIVQKVPAKITADDQPLSLIRFLEPEDQVPQKQKGIKVKDRKKVTVKIGKKGPRSTFKRRFVATKNGKNHVFTRTSKKSPKTKKESLALQRLNSIYNLVTEDKVKKQMERAAKEKMDEVFKIELQKRIDKLM